MYECRRDGQAGLGRKHTYVLKLGPAFWGARVGRGVVVRGRNRFVWEALECSDNKSLYLFLHLSNGNEQPVSGRLKEGFFFFFFKAPALG